MLEYMYMYVSWVGTEPVLDNTIYVPDRHIEGRGRWRGKIGFESRNVSCIPTPDRGGGGTSHSDRGLNI